MEEKLRENDHKGGWGTMSAASLFVRLVEETGELASLVDRMRGLPEIAWRAKIAREAADVANFAMMIADNFGSAPREV
jgi:NTP pyrophosphatase (non-canonical NTP hydrolase)